MGTPYINNYIFAVENPLPELMQAFENEINFLKKNITKKSAILEVGCGIGRPAIDIAPFARKIVAIDNDQKMLDIAKNKAKDDKVEFLKVNALNMDFPAGTFDVVYSTYNLIGSFEDDVQIKKGISEMSRVAKKGGKVIVITWKEGNQTTKFLKKYYPSIGLDITEIDDSKTITLKGTFRRFSKEELIQFYESAGLEQTRFFDIHPVWYSALGRK